MAKKKKKSNKKKSSEAISVKSPFWPLTGAILLILAGLFLLLGGFGTGGPLPQNMFDGVYWAFGWAAYLAPLALVYFGVVKFINESYEVPLNKLIAMLSFVVMSSAFFHTLSVDLSGASTEQHDGGNGGSVGAFIAGAVLTVLNKGPSGILFLVLAILMFFLAFNISPKVFAKLFNIFKRPEKEPDTDLNTLKDKQFKLNEGVPTMHPGDARSPRLSSLKNTATKLTDSEKHDALTTSSDTEWEFPSIDLLNQKQDKANAGDVEGNAAVIRETFTNFNINVDMEGANVGPRVTQYTLRPPTGVKLTKITALENNLALDLAAHSIRIEAPIPGKRLVGIEVPNIKAATVRVSSLLQSNEWQSHGSAPLSFVIGRDIAGNPMIGDLAKMPHLLVAGQTGSGKSVMINTILTSLLYRNTPSDLKLILVDPKTVELTPYDDIPHLLTPVITEPEKCISALKWAVAEMERRYRALSEAKKRNIEEYNNVKNGENMPYIVIVIDELADLMMMAARDVEALIVRIAQKARAVGIHLILATQRPSVDVITGLIKANVPARIAFTTASQVDSRTIIDGVGAEKLLGRGDMLFLMSDMPKPRRVQGALIDNDETGKVTDFIRAQREPNYDDEVVSQPVQFNGKGGIVAPMNNDADDDMWEDAVRVVIEGRKASTSLLQRRLRVGYARAARLIETMEEQGIVGHADGAKPRDVLVSSMDEVFGGSSAPDGDVYDDMPDEPEENR
jgi:DNA segregation ATPase FtsK/SpoIIIE, S-DNA-T family